MRPTTLLSSINPAGFRYSSPPACLYRSTESLLDCRAIFATLFLLPLSFILELWTLLRNYHQFYFKRAPALHAQRVARIQEQVDLSRPHEATAPIMIDQPGALMGKWRPQDKDGDGQTWMAGVIFGTAVGYLVDANEA